MGERVDAALLREGADVAADAAMVLDTARNRLTGRADRLREVERSKAAVEAIRDGLRVAADGAVPLFRAAGVPEVEPGGYSTRDDAEAARRSVRMAGELLRHHGVAARPRSGRTPDQHLSAGGCVESIAPR